MKASVLFHCFFFIDFFFITTGVQCQSKSDSLLLLLKESRNDSIKVKMLNDLSSEYNKTGAYEQALEYSENALSIAENLFYKRGIGTSLNNIGNIYENLSKYDTAISYHERALEIFKEINDKKEIAISYNGLANCFIVHANYEKALNFYLQALKIAEESADKSTISKILNNIGLLYEHQTNYEKALEFLFRSLEIKKSIVDKTGMSNTYNNIGNIYKERKDYQKALEYYFNSLKIKEEIGNKHGLANTYYNIGNVYSLIKDYPQALSALIKSLRIAEELGDMQIIANSYNGIGLAYLNIGNTVESDKHLQKALSVSTQIGYRNGIKDSYSIYSQLFSKKQDYKTALYYKNLHSDIKDSLINENSTKQIADMQIKYESEKKESENQVLKKENKIKELEIQRKKDFQKILLFGIFTLIIFLAIFLYLVFSLRKSNHLLNIQKKELISINNKLVESENNLLEAIAIKDKFFSIISHDLRGPFISIMSVNNYLKNNIKTLTKADFVELTQEHDKVVTRINNLLENLLLWAKSQTGKISFQKEKLHLNTVVKNNFQLFSSVAGNKEIDLRSEINENVTVFCDKNMLDTIIRNLLSNAIKYSSAKGKVLIRTNENDQEIIVEVIDSGVGIKNKDLHRLFRTDRGGIKEGLDGERGGGLGLILCKEFVELDGGRIWAESEYGKGSCFKFSLHPA